MSSKSTTLAVGSGKTKTEVEISLVKVSCKPREAQHETRRVVEPESVVETATGQGEQGVSEFAPEPALTPEPDTDEQADPFAAIHTNPFAEVIVPGPPAPEQPEGIGAQPVTRTEQGVTYNDEWVDLTEQLAQIDRETRIEGMAIEATMPIGDVRPELIRDAFYLDPKGEAASQFCATVWYGLRASASVAVVRWTKTTGQYLGVIAPTGHIDSMVDAPYLTLLQLEWTQNVRNVPHTARLDMELISERARIVAPEAMERLAEDPQYLATLQDERVARRAELLAAARSGRSLESSRDEDPRDVNVLAELLASVPS